MWSMSRMGVLPQYTVIQPTGESESLQLSMSSSVLPSTMEKYSTSSPSMLFIWLTTRS